MRSETSAVFHNVYLFLAAVITIITIGFLGCSEDSGTAQIEEPVVTAISPAEAGMGDTIVISGSNFNRSFTSNRIVASACDFNRAQCSRRSIPVAGSDTHLVGLVPDGAMTGSIWVEDIDPIAGTPFFRLKIAPLTSNALDFTSLLRSGDVGKIFFSGSDCEFEIEASSVDEEYILIVFNDATPPSDSWTYWYALSLTSPVFMPAVSAQPNDDIDKTESSAGGLDLASGNMLQLAANGPASLEFKKKIRDEVLELLERAEGGTPPFLLTPSGKGFERPVPSAPKAPAQSRQFNVLEDPTGSISDPDNYVVITADLKYEGDHTLLYVDQDTPASNLTDTEARDLGITFDEQIYQTNRTHFGAESDINEDEKVAMLLTPRVNNLSYYGSGDGIIVGYFLPTDLLPRYVHPDATNGMEIFYSIIPDPNGDFGTAIQKDRALEIIREVLAHEFQHMIMFNYRVLIYGGGFAANYVEQLWLDEGLSHIAEDLNGYTSSNIARANLFLVDPGSANLLFKDEDNLDKRGAAFLFLRHLGDRFGNGIFKKLVQSMSSGQANVEAVTDEDFTELFADWASACYLSGTGLSEDERFNYASLDLKADFQPLNIMDSPGWQEITRFIETMSPEYILFHVPGGSSAILSIECEAGGRMNAIVVRIQ